VAEGRTINLNEVLDHQRFGGLNVRVVALCFIIMLCDGYDLTVIAFAMPRIAAEWKLEGTAAFGPVFSAAIVGLMIGSPLAGYVADRIGRKWTLISCATAFGLFVLATAFATSITQLLVLRFLSGIGLGGVIPLGIVMSGEFAPTRLRATMMSLATTGVTIGSGLPGLTAAWILPYTGWHGLFVVGGVVPIVIALVLIFAMPESVKYLALRPERRNELVQTVSKLVPDMGINPALDTLVLKEVQGKKPSVWRLFDGYLAYMTPLLWLMFLIAGMTLYFIQTWTPTIFLSSGRPLTEVAFAIAIFQAAGAVGGALMGWPVDRFGAKPVAVMFVLAIPAVAALGMPGASSSYLVTILALTGFIMLAVQLGANSLSALIYPTFIRANGVGFGLGSARVGQILGATGGGILVAMGVAVPTLFYLLTIPLAIGAVASIILSILYAANARASDAS